MNKQLNIGGLIEVEREQDSVAGDHLLGVLQVAMSQASRAATTQITVLPV